MSEMSNHVEQLIRDLKDRGWQTQPHPMDRTMDLVLNHPEEVPRLVRTVIDEIPQGGTFHDAALSFLLLDEWPDLVQHALEVLSQNRENEAAQAVIAYASLQCPFVLHPHLETIFRLRVNAGWYYENWPWREAGMQNFDFLRQRIEGQSASKLARKKAWLAMLETRDQTVLRYAIAAYDSVDLDFNAPCPPPDLDTYLRRVGFERLDNDLRPLYCEHAFHISFPPAYLPGEARPLWQRTHPTWHLEGSATSPLPFGGVGKGACGVCGNGLHHLLTLDPVPDGLPVTGLSRLSLSVCLSCYGWERPAVFYQHGQDGEPQNIGYEGPRIQPEFPTEALAQTDVWLVESDRRWRWQDWAQSSGCENLNRIGGHPCWIQDAEYPKCPHCGQTMGFLMQLEAGIPTVDGDEWLEGEGICYGFWCDSCRISAFLWQCT